MNAFSENETPATPSSSCEGGEDYYAAIERHFVQLRGSPLFITPHDWQLIHRWRQMQVPLGVVKEGLERAFEKRKSSRPVRSLSYCRQTVESGYRRHCEAMAGSHRDNEVQGEATGIQSYLGRLEEQLRGMSEKLETSHPALAEVAARSAGRLASLALETIPSDRFGEIEIELDQMDDELVKVAESSLGEGGRRRCREEAERSLADYQARMPDEIYTSALRSAYHKRLRAQLGLPALSLFYI